MLGQLLGRPGEHDAAGLQDGGAVGDPERQAGVLLHQQDGGAGLADLDQRVEDQPRHLRGEPQRRLVEEQEAGAPQQRAPDGEHLLLAAGERVGLLVEPLAEPREQGVDALQVLSRLAPRPAPHPQLQVLGHRQLAEEAAVLGHEDHAGVGHVLGLAPLDVAAVEPDGALPGLVAQQAGDGLEERGLPGAVGPQHREDLPLLQLQRDAGERVDAVEVERLDARHRQDGGRGGPGHWSPR